MNTTNKFFSTKEQYLAFRSAFAAAFNSPRNKKGQPDQYGVKTPGWLTASHFMAFNLVRRFPYDRGFTPITSKVKLDNGMIATYNIDWANRVLTNLIADAKTLTENKPAELNSWETPKRFLGIGKDAAIATAVEEKTVKRNVALKGKLDAFLLPFGGTLTIADVARLNTFNTEGV